MRLIAPSLLLTSFILLPAFSGCTVDMKGNGDGDGDGDNDGANTGGSGLSTGGSASGGAWGTGGSDDPNSGGTSTGGADTGAGGSSGGGDSSGGQTGTGGNEPTGSNGCGTNAGQQLNTWVASNLGPSVNNRSYDTRLPTGYDPDRAYPVVLLLHGCGSPTNNISMENQTGSDAIVVRGAGSDGTCWNDSANGPDVAYIDALIEDVKNKYCVDTDAIFGVGYSSGGWIANRLTCIRGNVFRGFGTVAGGEPGGNNSGCVGQVARMFINDNNDNDNEIAWSIGARDRQIAANGCTNTTMPVSPSPCVEYQGCDPGYPVVWCATSGQGHNKQDALAAPAFWNFFQSVMD